MKPRHRGQPAAVKAGDHPKQFPRSLGKGLPLSAVLSAGVLCLGAHATIEASAPGQQDKNVETLVVIGQSGGHGNGPEYGYVTEEASVGNKDGMSVLETPQSVSVVNRELMEVQQPATTSQALRYFSGINSESYGGFGTHLDLTRIRGIAADYYLDGLRLISNVSTWSPQLEPYTLERIEVLRGPASALYGQGSGGGIINQVSRRPEAQSGHEMILRGGSFQHRQIGFDSTGALNEDSTWLYRFTGTGLDEHGQIEDTRHKRIYLAPALTWQPNERVSWTLLGTYSNEPELPDYNSLPAISLGLDGSRYPQINPDRNYTDMDYQGSSRKQHSVSSLLAVVVNSVWTFNSNLRYMNVDSKIQRTAVYGFEEQNDHLYLKGVYELAPASSQTWQFDNHVSGKVELGSTTHALILGADYAAGTLKSNSYRTESVLFDPYDPVNYRPDIVPDLSDSMQNWPYNMRQEFERLGIYAQNQIAWQSWRLTLSGRFDHASNDYRIRSYAPAWNIVEQNEQKWTWRAGLGYVSATGLAPYLSYSTLFDPQFGADYSGRPFVPVESAQAEAGLKYHPEGSATMLTAAVFQLNQENVKSGDTQHLGFWIQTGEIRSRGAEFQAMTALSDNLNLIAGYTFLDTTVTEDALYQGKHPTQTPEHSATLWLDHWFTGSLEDLRVGAGMRYLGSTWGNPSNTFKVPAVDLYDLAVSYDLFGLTDHEVTLSLNVSNLSDKQYTASCKSDLYCFIGQGRYATATLTFRW
ncbi:TonB-dependent siderophore receptor [Photobacterium arenosum]|uniref:TonB-dependent siderophore receptor n=1 Tax=Photobacterium arenosum TaxID=2774143 RepID=UPI00288AB939|nr:TonB-dependent siderophore receptor [Photobacterium arenosum]